MFDWIADRVPLGLARAASIGALMLGLFGATLILAATAYGDWPLMGWAAVAFVMAGAWWQVADRLIAQGRLH